MATRSAVITGSTKGIGKGYAREFLKRGVNVMVSSRSQDDVDQTVLNLEDESRDGARAIGQTCNVADINQVQALWNRAKQDFGAVDIWINNAGFARSGVTLMQANARRNQNHDQWKRDRHYQRQPSGGERHDRAGSWPSLQHLWRRC